MPSTPRCSSWVRRRRWRGSRTRPARRSRCDRRQGHARARQPGAAGQDHLAHAAAGRKAAAATVAIDRAQPAQRAAGATAPGGAAAFSRMASRRRAAARALLKREFRSPRRRRTPRTRFLGVWGASASWRFGVPETGAAMRQRDLPTLLLGLSLLLTAACQSTDCLTACHDDEKDCLDDPSDYDGYSACAGSSSRDSCVHAQCGRGPRPLHRPMPR